MIFLVETNKQCNSDWMYIKSTLDIYFPITQNIHYQPVYMNGKSKYNSAQCQTRVNALAKSYAKTGDTVVFLCIDLDDWKNNTKDSEMNAKIENYCSQNGYHLIWFHKNIEHVFWKIEHVESKQKRTMANRFLTSNRCNHIKKEDLLSSNKSSEGKSNLLLAVSKYFEQYA